MEQDSVNQRLNLIVSTFENGKKAAFARKAGISPQGAQELLAGRKGDPSFKVLVKILESYPSIDANWLVLGQGAMYREVAEANDSAGKTLNTPLSQQVEALIKETIISEMSLAPAAKREAADAAQRAEAIASLEVQILNIRLKQEELSQEAAAIEMGTITVQNREDRLGEIRRLSLELTKDLHGKLQLQLMYRQEEKQAFNRMLSEAKVVSLQMTKYIIDKDKDN